MVINHLTRLGGILFETRYRAGYKGIIIPCHRFFSIHLNSEAKVPDFAYRLARVIALARRTWESCGRDDSADCCFSRPSSINRDFMSPDKSLAPMTQPRPAKPRY